MRSLKFGFEVRRRISKHGYFTEANLSILIKYSTISFKVRKYICLICQTNKHL